MQIFGGNYYWSHCTPESLCWKLKRKKKDERLNSKSSSVVVLVIDDIIPVKEEMEEGKKNMHGERNLLHCRILVQVVWIWLAIFLERAQITDDLKKITKFIAVVVLHAIPISHVQILKLNFFFRFFYLWHLYYIHQINDLGYLTEFKCFVFFISMICTNW